MASRAAPTNGRAPTSKAVAATGGSAFGAAAATLVLFGIDRGRQLPPEVSGAITTLVTAFLTLFAAYFAPRSAGE